MDRPDSPDEAGFTLIEVLAALLVLSLAVGGIVAAMGQSISMSDLHRRMVTSDAVARSYAEKLSRPVNSSNQPIWQECATPASGPYSPSHVELGDWPGYTATIVAVDWWNGTNDAGPASWTPSTSGSCPANSPTVDRRGLQRITVEAYYGAGKARQRFQILKRRP